MVHAFAVNAARLALASSCVFVLASQARAEYLPLGQVSLSKTPASFAPTASSRFEQRLRLDLADKSQAELWVTAPLDPNTRLKFSGALPFTQNANTENAHVVRVNPNIRHQELYGFGASLTEAAAINILSLPPKAQDKLLMLLFDKKTGAGLSYLRLPIGSSEFVDEARGYYTYDDTPNGVPDLELKYFSMARDQKSIELLKRAKAINPDMKLMLSPWSAPAWMKESNRLGGGRLLPQYRDAYARYLAKVIKSYEALGFIVDAVTIQNEPGVDFDFLPSMPMSGTEQADIVKNNILPVFKEAGIKAKVLAHDHNWDMHSFVNDIFSDADVKRQTAGVAYHCYAGSITALRDFMNSHPGKEIYQTECTGSLTSTNFAGDMIWWMRNQVVAATRFGARTALAWNLALDKTGGPVNRAGCSECRGLVNVEADSVKIEVQPELISLAHVAKFLKKGAVRIETEELFPTEFPLSTGFINPDGSVAVVIHNPSDNPAKFAVERPDRTSVVVDVPPYGAVTVSW